MGKSVFLLVQALKAVKGHLRSHVVEIAVLTISVLVLVIPLIIFYFPRTASFQVRIVINYNLLKYKLMCFILH